MTKFAAIGDLFDGWPSLPGWLPVVGPLLYEVGTLVVLIRLALARRLPWWTPVLVLIGFTAGCSRPTRWAAPRSPARRWAGPSTRRPRPTRSAR